MAFTIIRILGRKAVIFITRCMRDISHETLRTCCAPDHLWNESGAVILGRGVRVECYKKAGKQRPYIA